MFLTVNKDVLTMLMTSLARDASDLGSTKVGVEANEVGGGVFLVRVRLEIVQTAKMCLYSANTSY